VTPAWVPDRPSLVERERIRLLLAGALERYADDDLGLRQFIRGMVNFNGPPDAELVGVDVRRAIHRQ
jgi:hypothetical protein